MAALERDVFHSTLTRLLDSGLLTEQEARAAAYQAALEHREKVQLEREQRLLRQGTQQEAATLRVAASLSWPPAV